tara:strand:- start:140 stop:421 length:282 start_codon:yes stop_codon:yes gene_type:complete
MKDKKTTVIIVLAVVVVLLLVFIGYSSFKDAIVRDRDLVYAQGLQDGRLSEQRDILSGVFAQGFYIIPVVDEQNQTQQVALGVIPPDQFQESS